MSKNKTHAAVRNIIANEIGLNQNELRNICEQYLIEQLDKIIISRIDQIINGEYIAQRVVKRVTEVLEGKIPNYTYFDFKDTDIEYLRKEIKKQIQIAIQQKINFNSIDVNIK